SPAKVLVVCAEISSTGRQMLLSTRRLWSEVYVSGESPQSAGGRAPRRSCIPVSSALPRAPASSRAYGARRAVPDRPPRENRRATRDTRPRTLPPRRRTPPAARGHGVLCSAGAPARNQGRTLGRQSG